VKPLNIGIVEGSFSFFFIIFRCSSETFDFTRGWARELIVLPRNDGQQELGERGRSRLRGIWLRSSTSTATQIRAFSQDYEFLGRLFF
jgi:hypothetical protein